MTGITWFCLVAGIICTILAIFFIVVAIIDGEAGTIILVFLLAVFAAFCYVAFANGLKQINRDVHSENYIKVITDNYIGEVQKDGYLNSEIKAKIENELSNLNVDLTRTKISGTIAKEGDETNVFIIIKYTDSDGNVKTSYASLPKIQKK